MRDRRPGRRLIIPIFITHQGCPHRCVFCNQEIATGRSAGLPSVGHVRDRIVSFLGTMEGRRERREVAFYGGTFTALPRDEQETLLRGVSPFIRGNKVDALRISTRPDAIEREGLELLSSYHVETVEVGAQSMVDEILSKSRRGHTRKDVEQSVDLLRRGGFEVGIQIMLGLPGEDIELFLMTVRRVVDLNPDFVRIYPLLVMKGSPLEGLHRRGLYEPLSLVEAVEWAKEGMKLFEKAEIPVIRVGLQATDRLGAPGTVLAGPYHPGFRSLVESSIFYDMASRLVEEGSGEGDSVRFFVSPGDRSYLTGEKRENLSRLKKTYGLESIEIFSSPALPRGRVLLESSRGSFGLSRVELAGRRRARP
ncbi:MAG: radical SAM protein [Deltaproteobacteria bacterium]|nr:radical SAM protein [Deltaproteobacteria bacterium]